MNSNFLSEVFTKVERILRLYHKTMLYPGSGVVLDCIDS